MIFEQFSNLKYKFGNRHFWCKGYFVSTVGVNEATIIKYIREQETRDKIADQLRIPGSKLQPEVRDINDMLLNR